MKRNKILLPIIASLGVIAIGVGSTIALFKKSAEVDVDVESAKFNLSYELNNLKLYSADYTYTEGDLIEESSDLDTSYYYKPVDTFLGGGSASIVDNSKLKISNMTPGDKVSMDIKMSKNDTNTKFKYRLVLETTDTSTESLKFFSNLKISAFGTTLKSVKSFATKWSEWDLTNESVTKDISISYPLTSDGFSGAHSDLKIRLEAVQINAATTDLETSYISINDDVVTGEDDKLDDLVIKSNAKGSSTDPFVELTVPLKDGDITVNKGDKLTMRVENASTGNLTLTGKTPAAYDVSLFNGDTEISSSATRDFSIKMLLGLNATIEKIYLDGTALETTAYVYDEATGYLTITSKALGTFVIDCTIVCIHQYHLGSQTDSTSTYVCALCGETKEESRYSTVTIPSGISATLVTSDIGYFNPAMITYGIFNTLDISSNVFRFIKGSATSGGFYTDPYTEGTIQLVKDKSYISTIYMKNTGDTTFTYDISVNPILVDGVDIADYLDVSIVYKEFTQGQYHVELEAGVSQQVTIVVKVLSTLPDELVNKMVDNISTTCVLTAKA